MIGLLCVGCAAEVAPCSGLLHEHVSSPATPTADAGLVDGCGRAHPVRASGTRIGRKLAGELALLHGSVSREHVELARAAEGWHVRDRGSRNGTRIDGKRVLGRAALVAPAVLAVGEVKLWFVEAVPPVAGAAAGTATTHGVAMDDLRFTLRREARELCVLVAGDGASGGAVLYREEASASWSEIGLSPLELHLLRILCHRAVVDADSPSPSRGCVPTRQLVQSLPFQSAYADEENVRQVVRRLRTALASVDFAGVVDGVQGRGYFVSWSVTAT